MADPLTRDEEVKQGRCLGNICLGIPCNGNNTDALFYTEIPQVI